MLSVEFEQINVNGSVTSELRSYFILQSIQFHFLMQCVVYLFFFMVSEDPKEDKRYAVNTGSTRNEFIDSAIPTTSLPA